jgi:hypothetical protein
MAVELRIRQRTIGLRLLALGHPERDCHLVASLAVSASQISQRSALALTQAFFARKFDGRRYVTLLDTIDRDLRHDYSSS